MSDEDPKDDVEEIQPDAAGKFPETVPWEKYVGVKESLGGKLAAERTKVTGLEEKAKGAVSPEEHQRIVDALGDSWTKHQTTADELKGIQDKSVTEKREALKDKGISEEDLNKMSEAELNAALKVVGNQKPLPDLGGGGGSGALPTGSPMELARQAYENSGKK